MGVWVSKLGFLKENISSSQTMVLASRASGCLLDAETLKKLPSGHPKDVVRNFLKWQSQAYN